MPHIYYFKENKMPENNPITNTKLDRLIGFKEKSGHSRDRMWAQEKELIALLAHIAENNYVFYDAGANRGFYPIYIQHLTNNNCDIKMFEPFDILHKELKEIMKRYPKETMTLYPYGLWSKKTRLPFYARTAAPRNNKTSIKASSFMRHIMENTKPTAPLEVITIDSIIGNDIVNFLKIDTEGCEEHVINGASESLKTHRIKTIFVEAHTSYYGSNLKRIVDSLRGFGYKVMNRKGVEDIKYGHKKFHIYATLLSDVQEYLQDFDLHQYYVTLNG